MAIRQKLSKRADTSLHTAYVPRYLRADYDPDFSLQDSAALFRWLDETNLVWTYHRERKDTSSWATDPPEYKVVQEHEAYRDISRQYERVTRKTHSNQQACANAWADRQWPVHNISKSRRPDADRPWPPGSHGASARLYSSPNFEGIQHADGSGRLRHYRMTEAWRTRSGLIISNVECWSRGFAHCTVPGYRWRDDDRNPDYRLSESAVEQMARMVRNRPRLLASDGGQPNPPNDDKYDLMSIEQIPDGHTKLDDSVENLRVFQFYSGAAVILLTDLTARGTGGDRVAFALSPDEARPYRLGKRHWARVVEDHLTPDEVRDSDLPVVGAHESEDDSRIPGDAIVRQGEWFFIPTDSEPQREVDSEIAADEAHLGSHEPRDFGLDYDGTRYVRGWLSHDRDHERAYIGEVWHTPVEHDRDDVQVFDSDERSDWNSDRRSSRTRVD